MKSHAPRLIPINPSGPRTNSSSSDRSSNISIIYKSNGTKITFLSDLGTIKRLIYCLRHLAILYGCIFVSIITYGTNY